VNVHQAKTHLSQLLQAVERGQEVLIARSGVPIARLVACQAPPQPVAAPGAMRGQISLADDFDAPLDAGLIQSVSQVPWAGLSAWVEVGGIAPFPCPTSLFPQSIST